MSKYDNVMMETAHLFSRMSSCKRKQVGAVLSTNDRIRSTGYNGTIKGKSNICEDEYFQCEHCFERNENLSGLAYKVPKPSENDFDFHCSKCNKKMKDIRKKYITNDFTLHAEQNALTDAASQGISTQGATMYITLSPCKQCAKLMAQAGIKKVVYDEEYRDKSGIQFLKSLDIETFQLNTNKNRRK